LSTGAVGNFSGSKITKNILKNYGVTLSDANFSRSVKELGIKANKIAGKNTTWIEPSEEEFKNIAEKNKIRRSKSAFATEEGKEALAKRKEKIVKAIKDAKGNITVKRIRDLFEGDVVPTKNLVKEVAEELGYTLPSGRAKGNVGIENINTRTRKLIEDINILKNDKKLNNIINKPDFDVTEDILKLQERATKILPKSDVDPVRRVAQLLIGYSGDDPDLAKYVGKVSDDLKMAAENISPGLRTGKFGGLIGSLTRIAAEKKAALSIGKEPGFFSSQRKRLGELIQSITGKKGMASIDEVKAISGNRAKSPIYNIFVQGIKQNINEDKLNQIDRLTANAEINLQNAKTEKEKIKIKDEYNARVQEFVDDANKNLKPGQLPVRAFKLSLDKPSNTIKNKEAYTKNKSYFDDIYNKHGYSFEVPKDILTSEQARTYLNTDEGKARIKNQVELGSNRLFSIAFPFLDPKLMLQGLSDVAKFFGTPSVAATLAGTTIKENLEKGDSLLDAATDKMVGIDLLYPELAKQTVGRFAQPTGRGILSMLGRVAMNPFGRAARAFTPVGAGITAIGLGKDYYDFVQSELARKADDPEAYAVEQEEQMGISAW